MQFSENWLREWVNPDITTEELVSVLTMAGLEVDSVAPVAGEFSGVVVGHIVHVEPHPDAKKLRVCQVDAGDSEQLTIVCGAPNARVGIKVPCAKVGAVLPGDFKIKEAELRGVTSRGMLCAEAELGLAEESDGLMELSLAAEVGRDFRELLGLDDNILEVDLTPNRGDCLAIAGLARELGALKREEVSPPVAIPPVPAAVEDTFPVTIEAEAQCSRYVGRVIKGVDVGAQTPLWMVEKLRRSGIRSIGPVVDVTNFVMMELGQPMHAFDLMCLAGGINVRLAREGEELRLLDGQEVTLDQGTLVIADQVRPLAMAGVMGGEESAVSSETKDIFLESAFFEPIAIAGKARGYGLHTDSSHRFERGVDFELQGVAVERATALLLDIVGGQPGPVIEVVSGAHLPVINPILLRAKKISRVLGLKLPTVDVEEILLRLGMQVREVEDGWMVLPPSYRFDVRIELDLVEELGRVWGYNRLPTVLPEMKFAPVFETETRVSLSEIRQLLINRGYQEAICYSFVDRELLELVNPNQVGIELANPISADMSVMRTTMWAGLLKAALYNVNRQQGRVRLFETGQIFQQEETLRQSSRLAGLIWGDALPESWNRESRSVDFFDIKGDVELLLGLGTADEFEFEPSEHKALHPGQGASIVRGGKEAGLLGALHPLIQRKLGFPTPVFLFEIDLAVILNTKLPSFRELSKFPEVRRDLAVIVNDTIPSEAILKAVRQCAGEWLVKAVLFDVYQGANLQCGQKSIGFGVTLQHPSRTLTDDEVNTVVDRIVASLKDGFNGILRE